MGKFFESLKGSAKIKNHRAAKSAKVEIRQHVLNAVGRDVHVFDAFAGTGEMFGAVWHEAAGYVGCDMDWARDDRLCYVADNRRVLRAIDLRRFSIFDLDAFGSPWEQAIIVARRREVEPGELIGLILTDGSGLSLKQGGLPKALAMLTGMRQRLPGLQRWQDDLISRAIDGVARMMGCTVEARWQAIRKTGAGVRYVGLVLRGKAPETPEI